MPAPALSASAQAALERRRAQGRFRRGALLAMLGLMLLIWSAGVLAYAPQGNWLGLLLVIYIGACVGVGLGLYIASPSHKRPQARRPIIFMVGLLLLLLALFSDHGNMQIEGLFFGLLLGSAPYILLHFVLVKVVGPLAIGRIWCGWACWFGAVFDLLSYPFSRYRHAALFSRLRYVHFGLSLLLVLTLALTGANGALGAEGYAWFVVGLLAYYVAGVGLAFTLKDNRAFCKYLCPLAVLLKAGARYSLLKIDGVAARCDGCKVCVERCPMNVRIDDYIRKGQRVTSSECVLCMTCINLCPQDALRLSLRTDAERHEWLDYVPPLRRRR
ncbi:MAG: 4Fe-4S binding protein [Anaerolineae bacterium]|nr:4Fe-4S binding protein [Anaerolineae bacterium]MDW8173004.1 4Fe-4S binding protein [Anaerolineae bacterium]